MMMRRRMMIMMRRRMMMRLGYVLTYVLPGFVSVVISQSACLEGYKEYCYKNLND